MNTKEINKRLNIAIALTICALLFLVSCSDNNDTPYSDNKGQLRISAKSTYTNTSGKSNTVNKVSVNDLEITKLLLNIKELELEVDNDTDSDTDTDNENDDSWDDDGALDADDELELAGPFEIDLLSGKVTFLDAALPTGTFEELEFKFAPSTDTTSVLFEKSILIEGNINGTPFVFWHNFKEEVEVDFEDTQVDFEISESGNDITVVFDINQVFDLSTGIDLSTVSDGNGDGVIEISPNDPDGNNDVAQNIKNKIKSTIDLLDD